MHVVFYHLVSVERRAIISHWKDDETHGIYKHLPWDFFLIFPLSLHSKIPQIRNVFCSNIYSLVTSKRVVYNKYKYIFIINSLVCNIHFNLVSATNSISSITLPNSSVVVSLCILLFLRKNIAVVKRHKSLQIIMLHNIVHTILPESLLKLFFPLSFPVSTLYLLLPWKRISSFSIFVAVFSGKWCAANIWLLWDAV